MFTTSADITEQFDPGRFSASDDPPLEADGESARHDWLLESTAEGQRLERKSIRKVTGRTADFSELARDCVCFANGSGGALLIGIEDGKALPSPTQRIEPALADRVRKRIGELTVNVEVLAETQRHENGGEFMVLKVLHSMGVASTSDGRFFLRVGDTCRPVVGDEVLRLASERSGLPWETMTTLAVPVSSADRGKLSQWVNGIRTSDRVNASVKEKSDEELLQHYWLASAATLTNLGVLLLGTAANRARLGTAPIVQAIKYDERGEKLSKLVWDDFTLSPLELVDAIWKAVPDFRESYELPDGMNRTSVPAFEEAVVRELIVNALAHRPYTHRGDIFLNLHPDHLEVVNPGRLPLGVTPRNILHASRRRNDGLARVFHDLKLMEREGSGFDLMYEHLLTSGRAAPTAREGVDSVHVVVPKRVLHPGVIRLIAVADREHRLTQRERIALGLLGQTESLSSTELARKLELDAPAALRTWIARLLDVGLIEQIGRRTSVVRYVVPPELLRAAGLDRRTTPRRVQPHRLRALIVADLERFPNSPASDIHRRVGSEIPGRTLKRALDRLVAEGRLLSVGDRRWRRYRAVQSIDHQSRRGR